MLKKLLKYDLKWVFKVVIVFYLLALFFAVLTRLFFGINNSFMMNIVAQICSGTTISMIVSIIINNIMLDTNIPNIMLYIFVLYFFNK